MTKQQIITLLNEHVNLLITEEETEVLAEFIKSMAQLKSAKGKFMAGSLPRKRRLTRIRQAKESIIRLGLYWRDDLDYLIRLAQQAGKKS